MKPVRYKQIGPRRPLPTLTPDEPVGGFTPRREFHMHDAPLFDWLWPGRWGIDSPIFWLVFLFGNLAFMLYLLSRKWGL